jgi:hypothetical protein
MSTIRLILRLNFDGFISIGLKRAIWHSYCNYISADILVAGTKSLPDMKQAKFTASVPWEQSIHLY